MRDARETGSLESTYGAGSGRGEGSLAGGGPPRSPPIDARLIKTGRSDPDALDDPAVVTVQAMATPSQKIKIKIEVSQERGGDQDSARTGGDSTTEGAARGA